MYNFGLKVKASDFTCIVCGMGPLQKIEGREFWCGVCDKRVIIASDYYGITSAGMHVEEIAPDTYIVKHRD